MFSGFILVLAGLYILYKWLKPVRPPNFPPGPENYPIIGGALSLQKYDPAMGNSLIKFGEIYGPVTGLYLGRNLSLIINGVEAVKEVLTRDEFNNRPTNMNLMDIVDKERGKGIMFNNGDSWKEQRRFTIRHLRDLGFGKSSLEGLIHDEITELVTRLDKTVNSSSACATDADGVAMENLFTVSIINVLWHVVSGKRFSHDDEEFKVILEKLTKSFRSGISPAVNLIQACPLLRHLPYFKGVWNTMVNNETKNLMKESVAQHKKARLENKGNHDFINEYLRHLEEMNPSDESSNYYTEAELATVCHELFAAGGESTSNSIGFAMLYMLLYPEIQARVQTEIDSVVEPNRLPSLADRSALPYTEAVLEELFRITSIAPLTMPHSAADTTELCGYTIPKATMVMVNLHSVHMDKQYWGDPEVFRPERFIENGKFVKSERVLTFGLGKRICPGESLARMNYYLFFTAMLQKYRLEIPPGNGKPSTIPLPGFTIAPKPFKARLILRNSN